MCLNNTFFQFYKSELLYDAVPNLLNNSNSDLANEGQENRMVLVGFCLSISDPELRSPDSKSYLALHF